MTLKTWGGIAAAGIKTFQGIAKASVKTVNGEDLPAAAPFTCDSADFDGTNDSMDRLAALTGAANSKQGILSVWWRLDGGDGVLMRPYHGAGNQFRTRRETTNKFGIFARNGAGADILNISTTSTLTAGAAWRHILASWDLGTAGARHIYVDDVSDLTVTTFTNDTIAYASMTDFTVSGFGGGDLFNGCMAEVYMGFGQYLDFSVEANRRKFISAAGKPVSLGSDGSTPTGTAPIMYFHLDDGEAVANFRLNRGTGGNFTITGTLTTGSTSPSD